MAIQRVSSATSSEVEQAWTTVLGKIFEAVDWKKMRGRRSRLDIFEHRLAFAKYEQDIPDVIQRLCNTLSLQAPTLPIERVDYLREHRDEAMEMLRRWDKLLTMKAAQFAGYL